MSDNLREQFDHRVWVKATIGFPFTMEDVARTMEVPGSDLRSSWMTPHVNSGLVRIIGTEPSKNPKAKGRHINVYSGTYYLDLEEEERKAEAAALLAEYEQTHGEITEEEIAALDQELVA